MKKRIRNIILILGVFSVFSYCTEESEASEECFYETIEQTEDRDVIEISEKISSIYPICPELVQAIIFYESSNRREVISRWGGCRVYAGQPKMAGRKN